MLWPFAPANDPTPANRFHLTWVGSGPRHDIAASRQGQHHVRSWVGMTGPVILGRAGRTPLPDPTVRRRANPGSGTIYRALHNRKARQSHAPTFGRLAVAHAHAPPSGFPCQRVNLSTGQLVVSLRRHSQGRVLSRVCRARGRQTPDAPARGGSSSRELPSKRRSA